MTDFPLLSAASGERFDNAVVALRAASAAGVIWNQDWIGIKYVLDNAAEKAWTKTVAEPFFYGRIHELAPTHPDRILYVALSYVSGLRDVATAEKRTLKAKIESDLSRAILALAAEAVPLFRELEALKAKIKKGRKPSEKPSEPEPPHTCQICARHILDETGVIAHHGYQRPQRGSGWQTASCFGARRVAYEVGHDALDEIIPATFRTLASSRSNLQAFRRSPPDHLSYNAGTMRAPEIVEVARPEGFDPALARGRNQERRSYASLWLAEEFEQERTVEYFARQLEFFEKRRAEWKAP